MLLDGLDRARTEVGTKSTRTDMVTEMDRASEALLVAGIRAARPDDAILGEEGTDQAGTSGLCWVIDPLDGTTNYLYGLPGFAVSIAVRAGDRRDDGGATDDTVVGVVVDPARSEMYWAAAGTGAFRNGVPIRVNDHADLATALVATGFGYAPAQRARQATVLSHVLPRVRDIRRFGAAAVDLCLVATGRVDAYYEVGLQPWDVAAGELIAREAGAHTGDLDGGPAGAGFTLAAGPHLFDPLRRLLIDAGA